MSTPVTQPPMPPGVIRLENVSKFYGDVLGVNRVTLAIPPGITSLVGPNGSGKTTLMNLMAGLISPSDGQLSVLGITPDDPERLFRILGYCAQFDTFPRGVTGFQFLRRTLLLHGLSNPEAESQAWAALERVGMTEAAHRSVAAYSKGMRQRVKLAQALAHRPRVLLLDEPLNGLDPMARAETLALFRALGAEGMHVIVSSHILHEVDQISDQVILINQGYVVAEGQIRGVRSEVTRQPMQIHVRSDQPRQLAREMMLDESVVEAKILSDGSGVLFRTLDVEQFYDHFEQVVLSMRLNVQQLRSTDEDADSVYHYLIGEGGGAS